MKGRYIITGNGRPGIAHGFAIGEIVTIDERLRKYNSVDHVYCRNNNNLSQIISTMHLRKLIILSSYTKIL